MESVMTEQDFPPGEGPITEDEAKAAVAAEPVSPDDEEPPAEPLEDEMAAPDDDATTAEGDDA
jgi:hypothetical protein